MNTIHLTGNLTADCEHRKIGENDLCTFTLAAESGREADATLFLKVSAWNQPHLRDYLGKGSRVLLDGSLRQENWETPEGDKRSLISCLAHRVEFIHLKEPAGGARSGRDGGSHERSRSRSGGSRSPESRGRGGRGRDRAAVEEPAAAYA